MKNKNLLFFIVIIIFLNLTFLIWTKDKGRTEPLDVIIALDKSKSMALPIESVKTYVNNEIIDKFLQKGDYFMVILFYGQTLIPISTYITSNEQKEQLKKEILKIKGDGAYTDIGKALDRLSEELKAKTNANHKKTLLMLTDGKNEPPSTSMYYRKDPKLNHKYLQEAREKQMAGWKIYILGVGKDGAKEIADPLNANYIQTSNKLTSEELKDKKLDIAGRIFVKDASKSFKVNQRGKANFKIKLLTQLFSKDQIVIINGIRFEKNELNQDNMLAKDLLIKLSAKGEKTIDIPLSLSKNLTPGQYMDKLVFSFNTIEKFDSKIPVNYTILTVKESNQWIFLLGIIVGIIIILAIIGMIILLILKQQSVKIIKFKIDIKEHPLQSGHDIFKVKTGEYLFINEINEAFEVTKEKTKNSIAKIFPAGNNINLAAVKSDRFEYKTSINNLLNNTVVVKSTHKEECHINFKNA